MILGKLCEKNERMQYTGETFKSFAPFGFFDVALKRKYPASGGSQIHTSIVNPQPLPFARACQWMNGLLKPMGEGVTGFQHVIDCWLVPREDLGFVSSEARDAWLLETALAGARKRQQEHDDLEYVLSYVNRLFVAGQLTESARNGITREYATDPQSQHSQVLLDAARNEASVICHWENSHGSADDTDAPLSVSPRYAAGVYQQMQGGVQ